MTNLQQYYCCYCSLVSSVCLQVGQKVRAERKEDQIPINPFTAGQLLGRLAGPCFRWRCQAFVRLF